MHFSLTALAARDGLCETSDMEFAGRIHNGVVVLEGNPALPEGARVTIFYAGSSASRPEPKKGRIEVPRVRTGHPGTVKLAGERIAEILDEEDVFPRR
ncbi:MAG: hypothetical protein ACREJM_12220 [Candidatus Saccharimonadales bacterium]